MGRVFVVVVVVLLLVVKTKSQDPTWKDVLNGKSVQVIKCGGSPCHFFFENKGSNLEKSFKREISTSHKERRESLSMFLKSRDPTSKKVLNAKSVVVIG